jgi:NADH:ubiquinone oxidoreductase subunit K
MTVGLPLFLAISAILFSIGLVGVILLSLEVMLNSVNLTLVAFSREVGGSDGQIFALIVMGIAAAEVVVGLGLVVAMTRREMVLDTDELRTLNG